MTFAEQVLFFTQRLHLPVALPAGVEVMNPFGDAYTREICSQFYTKYYNDDASRWMMIGINPGRFGGGNYGHTLYRPHQVTEPVRYSEQLVQKAGAFFCFYV